MKVWTAVVERLCFVTHRALLAGNKRIRLYLDEDGQPKGDGKCTYLRVESVALAMTLLHEADIKPGYKVNIQRVGGSVARVIKLI